MSMEIIQNDFMIPVTIPYYYPGGLPFAYSPLPFYIQAILIELFSPDLFITVNALPPFFSILSLIGFYFLARKIINNRIGIIAAVLTFSIIPIAFTEQIEAMGLSESLGTLFLILYTFLLLWARDRKQKSLWIIPGLFLGFCIMSSPGSIYASILISMLFLGKSIADFFLKRESQLFIGSLIVGVAGIIFSSPYWFTVISNHGAGIFLNSFSAQNTQLFKELYQDTLNLELIYASPFWNILFLFGLISAIIKKYYSLILFSIVLLPIPRENWIMSIPASLLIGIGILYLLEIIETIPKINTNFIKVAVIWTMILFFGIDSGANLLFLINDNTYDISTAQIDDLNTIRESNLIPIDKFVAVIGNWGLIEWSPAIMQRTVINNPFGLEWLPDQYKKNITLSENLLGYTDPSAIMEDIQETFEDVTILFLVADKDYLTELNITDHESMLKYEILHKYDDLGLGRITVKSK